MWKADFLAALAAIFIIGAVIAGGFVVSASAGPAGDTPDIVAAED